ncbi:MAG: class I SAM-dependent methyltransferase [Alphaproteobacteria bacterium]
MSAQSPLIAHFVKLIETQGPIGVDRFMTDALMHPQHGYYVSQTPFGRGGDFITAPDISQMFGELVGVWAADSWDRIGRPHKIALVELGPGRGTLMADALRALHTIQPFLVAMELHMVEGSDRLRAIQSRAIDRPITHHTSIEDLPRDCPIIVIANEFLDALPIKQFQKTAGGWRERLVDLNRTQPEPATPWAPFRFQLSTQALKAPAALLGSRVRGAALGAIAEKSPACESVVSSLARQIGKQGGAALFIDYGPRQSALGDSLQAVQNHQYAPLFDAPGTADLTAHVDFEALKTIAAKAGAACFSITDQGEFLKALGIEARASALIRTASPKLAQDVQSALHRLTHQEQMGQLFKVLAFAQPGITALAGLPYDG